MNIFNRIYNLIMQEVDLSNVFYLQKITKFTKQDLDLIHTALNLSAKASGDNPWEREGLDQKLQMRSSYGQTYYLIKKAKTNQTVGIVQLGVGGKSVCVSNFAIFKQFQRKGKIPGCGKPALQTVIQYIKSKYPGKSITLGVAHCNPNAKSLYQKLGFKEIDTNEHGIHMELKDE